MKIYNYTLKRDKVKNEYEYLIPYFEYDWNINNDMF